MRLPKLARTTRVGAGGVSSSRLHAPDERTLSLRLHDFTWKGGDFRFAGDEAAGVLAATLSGNGGAMGARRQA